MTRDSNKSSTVLKAFQVLETVANLPAPATAPEISKLAEIERVTTYRLLRTIEHAGYIEIDAETKTYRISRRMLALAKPVLNSGTDRLHIERMLSAIAQRTGETCHYSELMGYETVLIQKAKGTQLVAVDFSIGNRGGLHSTSVGKAILAFQPDAVVDAYFERDLKKFTSKTCTDKSKMHAELAAVRSTGMAFDFEELADDMNCVAVPVADPFGAVSAGVSISGPASRFTKKYLSALAKVMTEEVANAL
jgi:DNA-binding IclR family transcriptional regulator